MLKKTIFLLAAFFFIAAVHPQKSNAYVNTADTSARMRMQIQINPQKAVHDQRVETLRAYLQSYNSPLADSAETFVNAADANNLDWKLVAAISGVESGFGQAIPPYSYNGWGFGVYGGNVRNFNSWDDAINTISKALREDYINQLGSDNVWAIGSKYAADPAWAAKVEHYMAEIDAFRGDKAEPTLSISL